MTGAAPHHPAGRPGPENAGSITPSSTSMSICARRYGDWSSAAQTVAATRPPGRATRRISARPADGSGKNWTPCWARTTSNVASSHGRSRAEPSAHSIGVSASHRHRPGDRDHRRVDVDRRHPTGGPDPLGGGAGDEAGTAGHVQHRVARRHHPGEGVHERPHEPAHVLLVVAGCIRRDLEAGRTSARHDRPPLPPASMPRMRAGTRLRRAQASSGRAWSKPGGTV